MSDGSKDAERRATEDLLAGFDRPGRSPRAPAVRQPLDFNASAAAGGAETVLVTRRRPRALWPWLVAAFVLSSITGVLAFTFVTRPSASSPLTASAAPPSSVAPAGGPATPASPASAAPPSSVAPAGGPATAASPASAAPPATSASAGAVPLSSASAASTGAPAASASPRPARKDPAAEHRSDFVPSL